MPETTPTSDPLLTTNLLIFEQTASFTANDFAILGPDGEDLGTVESKGSAAARFLTATRDLDVKDSAGTVVMEVKDPYDIGPDTFRLLSPEGERLAKIRKRFALTGRRVTIDMADGRELELTGDLVGWEFTFTLDGDKVARAAREWNGVSSGLLKRSHYAVGIREEADAATRLAIIGSVVALDLMRAKDSRN